MEIRPAKPTDLTELIALLAASDLNGDGVEACLADFVVAVDAGSLVGVAGLERCGDGLGLLRSLAVRTDRRGKGVGRALCAAVEARAAGAGIYQLYLLTTKAAPFFASLGFRPISRSAAPAPVQETRQFHALCPATAVVMHRAHTPDDPQEAP